MSERGGPVHSYTVRAHHHDGSGGSERAAPNRNTPLAWRVQGVAPNEGNGQGKDRGSGSGALNHARARAGTGSARTAQKNQTRCMPDLHEWVEHGQSHGGPSVTWDSPLTQGSSVTLPVRSQNFTRPAQTTQFAGKLGTPSSGALPHERTCSASLYVCL